MGEQEGGKRRRQEEGEREGDKKRYAYVFRRREAEGEEREKGVADSGATTMIMTSETARQMGLQVQKEEQPYTMQFGEDGSSTTINWCVKRPGYLYNYIAITSVAAMTLVDVQQPMAQGATIKFEGGRQRLKWTDGY